MSRAVTAAACVVVLGATAAAVSGAEAGASAKQRPSIRVTAECRSRSLQQDRGFVFQPAGSAAEGVLFVRSVRRTPCVLPRHIRVRFVGQRRGQQVRQVHQRLFPGEAVVRVLRPRRKVLLRIFWENWCHAGIPRALVVEGGNGVTLMRVPVNHAPHCYVPSQVSTVGVTPFFRVVHLVG